MGQNLREPLREAKSEFQQTERLFKWSTLTYDTTKKVRITLALILLLLLMSPGLMTIHVL